MGTDVYFFIEYDRNHPLPNDANCENYVVYDVIDFTDYYALVGGKGYEAFAAIAGVRNSSNIPPLYKPRGCPPGLSDQIRKFRNNCVDERDVQGWLYLSEIKRALEYKNITHNDLSLAMNVMLNSAEFLVSNLGDENVRIVFFFSD